MTEINETKVGGRVYEISFIFDNRLDESTALEKGNALKQSIATLGGSFISEEAPYMRELAYEMVRVVNNVNVKFSQGYFGWIKFDLAEDKIKEFEAALKLDQEVIRFLVVKTVRDNTVFTKRAPVIKIDDLAGNEDDVNIDTTKEVAVEDGLVPEVPEVVVAEEVK
ncbi:MAG: small subunit ribosomal protein [Patescibacteria group bacterium]|nr:small subunit ribosomal protein [Patescibacteria group bacterium]